MTSTDALVSVIIPTYNRPGLLKEAVSSVLAQSHGNLDIIVVDDYSDACYFDEIKDISGLDDRIRLIVNDQNLGVSASRNLGRDHMRGDFVIFLDDDDMLTNNFLSIALKFFAENPEVHIVPFPAVVHPESNRELFHYHTVKETLRRQPFHKKYHEDLRLLFKYPPQINSMVFRKEVFSIHQFDTSISFGEDMFLWVLLIRDRVRFLEKIPKNKGALALIRVHGRHHLSQTTHADVLLFLEKVCKQFADLDTGLRSIVDLKIFIRLLLMRRFRQAINALLWGLRRNPAVFLQCLVSQFRVKMAILFSYVIYKWFKIDV